jgi:hypothetical protein
MLRFMNSRLRFGMLVAGLTVTLISCGGGQEAVCELEYRDDVLGTCLPSGWHVVDREQLDDRGVSEEVIVAFQSDTPVAGQFPTVSVTREALSSSLTSEEYSDASIESIKGLPGYNEVDQQNVTVDGEKITLHIFTAQPEEDQPESRFYQVSIVNDNFGYTFTGATPVTVSDVLEQQVLLMLKNATVKPEETDEEDE